ncbi:pilus assembly protein TadG-related protein [Terasakiella sp. SH-1]|uniref:pilus assembly protein TadG-related protein n=1 Tax=Terasakiella sp. SH-1 TaxID=2560057 RepID=UPI00142FF6EA|nr:pilus assembly protein TadG-related protein [Terasakiella sp. SH-1]
MSKMQNIFDHLTRCVLRDERGSVSVYMAGFCVIALGLGALVIDTGRATVLKTQLQNRADAGALAGAAQLDGREGARDRATQMAMNAISQSSNLTQSRGELNVQSVAFYQEVSPSYVLADTDENAKFIHVTMAPQSIENMFFTAASTSLSGTSSYDAQAVAQPDPFMCHAPPLMICDLGENDPSINLSSNDVIGRQVVLKPAQGGDAWAPGNYGLLALPDGSIGANSLEAALAAIQPQDCYGLELGTAPGVKTNKIQSGMNARFEYETKWDFPAPNVISYPQDEDVLSGVETRMGDGVWDLATYWNEKHATPLPDELLNATRYQVYLYEIGVSYAKNGAQTLYPLDGSPLPSGFEQIDPPAAAIPVSETHPNDPAYDGVPSGTVASNGALRRVVQVAILQCIAEGVRGSHNYPSQGKYLEMFITEAVPDAPAGAIYGEIVRPLSLTVTPDFHANVRLVK